MINKEKRETKYVSIMINPQMPNDKSTCFAYRNQSSQINQAHFSKCSSGAPFRLSFIYSLPPNRKTFMHLCQHEGFLTKEDAMSRWMPTGIS